MDPNELPMYVHVVGALLSAMGIGKGSQWAFRKFGNGRAEITEPLTRSEFRDEMRPFVTIQKQTVEEQRRTTEAVGELASATREHQSWMKGFMEGQRE